MLSIASKSPLREIARRQKSKIRRRRAANSPKLDLPPPFRLGTLPEVGDAFAHAVSMRGNTCSRAARQSCGLCRLARCPASATANADKSSVEEEGRFVVESAGGVAHDRRTQALVA